MLENKMTETELDESILDELLATWSQHHRLSDSGSKSIHANLMEFVQTAPTEFSYAWWRRLFEQGSTMTPQTASFWSKLSIQPIAVLAV